MGSLWKGGRRARPPPQTPDCRSVWWRPPQWSISETLVLDLCLGAFQRSVRPLRLAFLTCRPLTSLVSQLNHELCRSEGVVSLSSFGLHGCVFLSEVCGDALQGRCCYRWYNTVWLLFVFVSYFRYLVRPRLSRDGSDTPFFCEAMLSLCLPPPPSFAVPHI